MKHVALIPAIVCLAGTMGACSYAPSAESAAAADYGSVMTEAQMRSGADAYLARALKDPDSRKVEWGGSGKAWAWGGLIGGGRKYGYGLSANVNAKNSFGGYVGSRAYFFFFRDGKLAAALESPDPDMCGFVP